LNAPFPIYRCAKRTLDIVLCATALLVLLPLFIPLIVILRLSGEGEVFYGASGSRVGESGSFQSFESS